MIRPTCLAALLLLAAPLSAQEAGRTASRPLFSFEQPTDAARLGKLAENSALDTVADAGVTEGKSCLRWVVPKGADYGVLKFDAAALKDWGDFDYFAVDVTAADDLSVTLNFELWDGRSKNFATRWTTEQAVRPGRQMLLFHVARARRNGKEGRDWSELEPADKIDRNALTLAKLFLVPPKDRDAVLWLDNLRLLQEDAAKPRLKVPLPAGALAWKFGSAGVASPGFATVAPGGKVADARISSPEATAGGEGWPDGLAGSFVRSPQDAPLEFRARVPDGEYRLWLIAGPILRGPDAAAPPKRFLLKANDLTLADASLTAEEFYSEKWLYRFLRTQYSERPHALWERYIDRMYPTHTGTVTVAEGVFTLTAVNHFVSACVLVPAKTSKEFDSFAAEARRLRVEAFEKTVRSAPARKPTPPAGDVPYLAFVPDDTRPITPHAGPSEAERARQAWKVAAAPSQRLSLRLAVVPFRDLGRGRLEVSDLSGPDTLSAKHARVYWLNHRSDGETISEMALVPGDALDCEAGVTQCFHVWWEVPADTRPGRYQGKWKFRPEKGSATELPVELEVYPFRLEEVLPFSFGMYYSPRNEPGLPEATQKRLLKEQLQFMRQVGFTAVPIGSPQVTGLGAGGKVSLRFDDTLATLAREVGMGRHPKQSLTGAVLPVGRAIGRRLPGSQGAAVDRQPGIELRQPEFRPYLQDALRQYRKHLDGLELPVAVEIVDEPREVPNPWNRNLADTLAYADLVRAAGLTGFVTPMGDTNGGKDYTVLADHADIVSVHAWKASEGLMERTRKNGKTLWLYNTGMDRLSWGFYNWRAGSQGRWEWHFGWHEAGARGGYPGSDWYNPFTAAHGFTSHAPAEFPGGMLFQSAFLEAAEGITDTAYLVTLEKAMAAAQTAGRHPAVVKEARGFLDALRRVIPAIPGTKGLATPADGALVGTGIDEEARWQTSLWREKVAELIRRLQ